MAGTVKMNALRSGVVVVGAMAFGYLTLNLGFKPYLEKAQLEQHRQEQALLQRQAAAHEESPPEDSLGTSSSGTTLY